MYHDLEGALLGVLSDPAMDLGLGLGDGRDSINPVLKSQAVFIDLPSVFALLERAPLLSTHIVRDVYKSLRFCVKNNERGATGKGSFVGETKLGALCVQSGK